VIGNKLGTYTDVNERICKL